MNNEEVNGRYRHKSGMVYVVITDCASLQCSATPEFEAMFDGHDWTVYRNVKTGAIWVRPTKEFKDGRFEKIEDEG